MNAIEKTIAQVAIEQAVAFALFQLFSDKLIGLETVQQLTSVQDRLCHSIEVHAVSHSGLKDFIIAFHHDEFVMTFEEKHARIKASVEAAFAR